MTEPERDIQHAMQQDAAWRKAGGPQRVATKPPADWRGVMSRVTLFRGPTTTRNEHWR